MKVIFFGTPDFALPSLQALYDNGYEILAVVCQPDKPRNRGEVTFCPIKEKALELGLTVLQYDKIRTQGYDQLKSLGADIFITCAYGQIISQQIIDLPKYGILNVHGSLLPKYRGSCPIQQAILNGEKQTGITIMKTALGIDSGDILIQSVLPIGRKMTAGHLFDELAKLGAITLIQALKLVESGEAKFYPQDECLATHYPMMCKEDGKIDWNNSAQSIMQKVLAFNPWPSAYTSLDGKMLKIWNCEVIIENSQVVRGNDSQKNIYSQNLEQILNMTNGQAMVLSKELVVKCGDNSALRIDELQLEGKKRMVAECFLLGNKITQGHKLVD